jgi:hypothetical protein
VETRTLFIFFNPKNLKLAAWCMESNWKFGFRAVQERANRAN